MKLSMLTFVAGISLLIVISFSGCVTYTHIVDAGSYNATNKQIDKSYVFAGTYSLKKFNLETPTYFGLQGYVSHEFGEKATFANVVWDVKKTNSILFIKTEYNYVTFDLYLPNGVAGSDLQSQPSKKIK